jgi:hypothetical protein
MANDEHVAILKKGADSWNAWRGENPDILPDLSRADLDGADLYRANLGGANLFVAYLRANLNEADLREADLSGAFLNGANLSRANLHGAQLSAANLFGANLIGADLSGADLSGANLIETILHRGDLRGADLRAAILVRIDLTGADLTGCHIYGVSAWGLKLEGAKQQNLVITEANEPEITADDIEVAQFIYLLLHNEKIRDVIDTITSKAVLILGRFTEERKPVLEALREELRQRKYLPILFDFEKPSSRSRDETITLLARMARFLVADISDAKSVLQNYEQLCQIFPQSRCNQLETQEEPGMFDFYQNFRSFLEVHRYASQEQLIAELGEKVIVPAEAKAEKLGERRRKFEAELTKPQ